MGSLLSFPLTLLTALRENSLRYNINYAVSYIYLYVTQWRTKRRFDLYDFNATGEPFKLGILVPEEEWELETPRAERNLQKLFDSVLCFATSPSAEYLRIFISRIPGHNVESSVILRTSDSREFHLPAEHTIQKSTAEDSTFGTSRLKLQCIKPMRKWRIFFNGILKEVTCSDQQRKYKHVKFSLIWSASTDVFDFSYDMSKEIITKSAASQKFTGPLLFIERLIEIFDCYHHPGVFNGTIKIEDEEEREIYLWGSKCRDLNKLPSAGANTLQIFGSFENGTILLLGVKDIAGELESFPFGYLMRPDGLIFAVDKHDLNKSILDSIEAKICFSAGGNNYVVHISNSANSRNIDNNIINNNAQGITTVLNLQMNGNNGNGFILHELLDKKIIAEEKEESRTERKVASEVTLRSEILTVCVSDPRCQDPLLTGGKGSSLAKLLKLSDLLAKKDKKPRFKVPNGIVVTTRAYEEFIKGELSESLIAFESDIWKRNYTDIEVLCDGVINKVSKRKLPHSIIESIVSEMKDVFGDSNPNATFSVRSSATGEDTEQMSAAGQMETFLGVKGLNEVLQAVTKCWASQFSFKAVDYKRHYGQKLNIPMAVIIQEMVPCESAGVMFSCDPVTGNPSFINITGNWGLGESVVLGSSEPDTIILKKNINNHVEIHKKILGDKKSQIVMDSSSGTRKEDISEELCSIFCISQNVSLELGKIAAEVDLYNGSPQDLEWGIFGSEIFLFQSRPVTSIDVDTEFEIKHFCDTFHRTSKEFFSTANVGEAVPGAICPLTTDLTWKVMDINYRRQKIKWDRQESVKTPYTFKRIAIYMNHMLFSLLEGYFNLHIEQTDFSKAFLIAMFGRLIDDREMRRIAKERFALTKAEKPPLWEKVAIGVLLFYAGIMARKVSKQVDAKGIFINDCKTAADIFEKITKELIISNDAINCHLHCTYISSIWNLILLTILGRSHGEWDSVLLSDLAILMKTNLNVLSADVPSAIEELAEEISKSCNPDDFKALKPEDALSWLRLETNTSDSAKKFKEFISNHGHRCIKECCVFSETWAMNPLPLISTLQCLVGKSSKTKANAEKESTWNQLSKLNVKIGIVDKIKLLFILPNARRCVRDREFSKSMIIKLGDKIRTPMNHLANKMVEEGRIPNRELLFFLTFEEIHQLLKNRSSKIVSKAYRRWKCHEELDALRFPEIMKGIPKPIAQEGNVPCKNGFTMTGVPVSQGIAKAPSRVILSVDEATQIQDGDILITYSTDIAWSPFFPRLAGVVTELGGLISHGAVVAREYGLPCVVGLRGATKDFKSGDIVLLDGNKGTLQKIG